MTPDREKLIRDHWAAWKHAWHATIGNEYKVRVPDRASLPPFVGGDNVVKLLHHREEILTFRRERHLGHYRVVCEGIVLEME